jgi:hypothetical protein
LKIANSIISKCIDKMDISENNKLELYLPYKFKLLLRGSRDGFPPKNFMNYVIINPKLFIKVKGTEEILGGYNPMIWETSDSLGVWVRLKIVLFFLLRIRMILMYASFMILQ